MGYSDILIDTSIIIDYLRKQNKKETLFWKIINEYNCYISSVTMYEIYSGAKEEKQKNEADIIMTFLNVISFDAQQARRASTLFQTLKKENRLIEFRDIFIASCAISKKIPLVSFNRKHFERIKELELFDY